jgi:predicted transcriptional regulator
MIDEAAHRSAELTGLTVNIVSAFVRNNAVPVAALSGLIEAVHRSLSGLGQPVAAPRQRPAVDPEKSIGRDYIICLEDGRKYKSLKRHLMTHHGMTTAEYRRKWGLNASYPMVAPTYAATRSSLAKASGFGRKGGRV